MSNFKLNPETDFTPIQLREWLNRKFSTKISGRPFTNQDVYCYARRGYLPKEYTGAEIKFVENNEIGVKILRLKFDKNV